jgi:hypothetical protein
MRRRDFHESLQGRGDVLVEPPLEPEDLVTPEAFAALALVLLRELATEDPTIAERAAQLGIDLGAP